jgi:hypothetical protein
VTVFAEFVLAGLLPAPGQMNEDVLSKAAGELP